MNTQNFDVIVIGAGPGGYVAAIRAAQLGKKTAIVEREHMGGICLNWGCIPTKALLKTASMIHQMHKSEQFGISLDHSTIKPDFTKIIDRSRDVAKKLSGGIQYLMQKNKITVINGHAAFEKTSGSGSVSDKTLSVTDINGNKSNYTAEKIILATGARAKDLPHVKADGKKIWSYKQALLPEDGNCPKSMIIVGSGAIGIEFAYFYRALGVDVTVVEAAKHILPSLDAEIAPLAKTSLQKQGIKFHSDTKLTKVTNPKTGPVLAELSHKGQTIEIMADIMLLAVGVTPNTDTLGLDNIGIKTLDNGAIAVNEYCQTTEKPHIYAIGDIVDGPWLAHKASHEGILTAEHAAGMDVHSIDHNHIPSCIYTEPQIAMLGLTEQQARDAGHDIKIGKFSAKGNGKSLAIGQDDGLVKVIFDKKTGELLGAHMFGPEVTEQIAALGVTKAMEGTEEDLIHTVFAHPTLSEMIHEAVLDAEDRTIHM